MPENALQRSQLRSLFDLIVKAGQKSGEDNLTRLSAAFSFFAVLSLAPVLVLAIVVAGNFFGQGVAREQLLAQARLSLGSQGQALVQELLDNATRPAASVIATVFSLSVTYFSASNLFAALTDSINFIWRLQSKMPLVKTLLFSRLTAFVLAAVFGILGLGWIAFDVWLSSFRSMTPDFVGWSWISQGSSLLFLTLVFTLTFKQIPANVCLWSDVWPGATVTAIGITACKWVLNLYFGIFNVSAAYGSAGALVVVLLWIFYAAQIFFFGVELTYAYTYMFGSKSGLEAAITSDAAPPNPPAMTTL